MAEGGIAHARGSEKSAEQCRLRSLSVVDVIFRQAVPFRAICPHDEFSSCNIYKCTVCSERFRTLASSPTFENKT